MMREHRRKNSRLYGFPTGHDDPVFPSIAKEGKPITKRAMQKSMTKILAAFGFEKISVHALRRTFATALYEISNKNIELVRQQLGHEDCRTTQVYIQTVYDEQEKAIQGIYNLP